MKFFSISRISFFVCFFTAFLLVITYEKGGLIYSKVETKIVDATAPVVNASSRGLNYIVRAIDNIESFFVTFSENKKLKGRNDYLEYYFYLYQEIEAENKQLKQTLNFANQLPYNYVSAMVISRNNASANQQVIINAGLEHGLKQGQMVLANNQLIGRIIQVSRYNSKVLLLTDYRSGIPVISANSRIKFIVAGQDTKYLLGKYLNEQTQLQAGELVITSGDNIEIAPNIIVGSVLKEENNFYVKPNIDFDQLEFVQILQLNHEK